MVVLLNCSFRGEKSHSNYFLGLLENMLSDNCKRKNLNQIKDINKLVQELSQADTLVLGMPLYVDGAPAQVVELMENLYQSYKESLGDLKVYVVTNLGFYEGEQAHILLKIVENWCNRMNFTYGGGVAIGAGEMLGGLREVPCDKGPNKMLGEVLKALASHINEGTIMENTVVKPSGFSKRMYMLAGNMNWAPQAKRNGLKKKEIKRRCCDN